MPIVSFRVIPATDTMPPPSLIAVDATINVDAEAHAHAEHVPPPRPSPTAMLLLKCLGYWYTTLENKIQSVP